jgi:hypothetical protein
MQKPVSLLNSLRSLDPKTLNKALSRLTALEAKQVLLELDDLYKKEPWLWFIHEVNTSDEATQAMRPWPDKEYLKDLLEILLEEPLVLVPKSRRMMVSWLVAAIATYEARYLPHNAIFIQSETEDKAAYITEKRCAFIEDHLNEPALRRKYRAIRTTKGAIGRITYEETGSYIWAIPQGGSIIRTYTFSRLLMDESEFQAESHEALNAAISIAENNKSSKIVLVSTSDGPQGPIADICRGAGFTRWIL